MNKLKIQVNKNYSIQFNTKSQIAKKWFFPRYKSGKKLHEPILSHLLLEYANSNSVFFDVGACLGYFSVLLGNQLNNGAIHSFEIDPFLACEIYKNFNENNIQNYQIFCGAVTNKTGQLLSYSPHQADNKSTNQITESNQIYSTSITLNDYCQKHQLKPDLMKIDVEGQEHNVLNGAISSLQNVRLLAIEIHPMFLNELKLQNIEQILFSQFNVYQLNDHRSKDSSQTKVNNIQSIQQNTILLCYAK